MLAFTTQFVGFLFFMKGFLYILEVYPVIISWSPVFMGVLAWMYQNYKDVLVYGRYIGQKVLWVMSVFQMSYWFFGLEVSIEMLGVVVLGGAVIVMISILKSYRDRRMYQKRWKSCYRHCSVRSSIIPNWMVYSLQFLLGLPRSVWANIARWRRARRKIFTRK